MYCPKCGTLNSDKHFRCIQCGTLIRPVPVSSAGSIEDIPAMRVILPVGRSVLSILAGYAGLFSILILPAPIALGLGIASIIDLKKHPEKYGMGRAVFAVAAGALFTIPLILFMILFIAESFQSK